MRQPIRRISKQSLASAAISWPTRRRFCIATRFSVQKRASSSACCIGRLRRVGICIPGGAAAYPSSVLMTVVPAQAAGVAEIAVVVPPTPFGGFNTDLLACCHALGVTEVYRIGGAQGVASLAYGLAAIGLEPVDKIVGPGNLFVALAKRHVYRNGRHRQHRRAERGRGDRGRLGRSPLPGRRLDQPGRAFAGRQHPGHLGKPLARSSVRGRSRINWRD